jgi:hypothetical protein
MLSWWASTFQSRPLTLTGQSLNTPLATLLRRIAPVGTWVR